ncbi:MAG: YegP family protein [Dehalococcoidia bacterium]|nr:YegP family protein [Dehalococcoidia bacterium]
MAEFEVRRSRTDQFYFVLQADNNEIVATSEMYTRKQSCLGGIDVVKRIEQTAMVNDTTG